MTMPPFITAPNLGVNHGFFTRQGGVSHGMYGSLNCSLTNADAAHLTAENRARAAQALGHAAHKLHTLSQFHSAEVAVITAPYAPEDRPRADAAVTAQPDILLGILTADCAPLLFCDTQAGVVGAAHSGWKGTLANITAQTVHAMEQLGATRQHIHAAIGPCIHQASYEVDAAFYDLFKAPRFFTESPKAEHYLFNLPRYIQHQMESLNLGSIHMLPHDTYAQEALFFSNRRRTHRQETGFGLQLSAIGLS